MIDTELKIRIDNMDYMEMLQIWRHGDSNNRLLQDETGDYFAAEMFNKKMMLTNEDQVAVSKNVGW